MAGAGDDDALPKQRPVFKPVDRIALRDDIADDGHGWCLEPSGADFFSHGAEGADEGLLTAMRRPADKRHGGGGCCAVLDQLAGDFVDALHAHEKDLGAICDGELRVV